MITQENLEIYLSEEYRKKIGARLKQLREEYNYKYTQKEVANMLHVERQHINRIENGKVNITIQELIYYSRMFGVDVDTILFGDEQEYTEGFGFKYSPIWDNKFLEDESE